MVISFAEAQARQLKKRWHKAQTARALEQAYRALEPYRTMPDVAQAVLKLRDAARQLESF